ncbi:MAG: hypothetical protein JW846_06165 [Dehalococcoidia bacterium]|nr:hypothetical protein [Dehalococcoidia bacterium]
MSQGKHISPIVKQIVAAAVAEHPKTTREELLPVICGRLRAAGKPEPATTTLLKLISQFRNRPTSDQDELWSLASLREYDLPAECLPTLMQVWRFALNLDQPLTVRQAYWASKLYTIFPNPRYLWMWAFAAAIGERSAELTGQPLATTVLDTVAADCSGWEQRTFRLTEPTWNLSIAHIPALSSVSPDGAACLEAIIAWDVPNAPDDDEAEWFNIEFSDAAHQLPTLDSIGLSFQAQMVYLRWFAFLSKGPKWKTISPEEAIDVVVSLRQWVLQQQTRLVAAQDEMFASGNTGFHKDPQQDPSSIAKECPERLLELVGYPPEYARTQHDSFVFSSSRYPYLKPE